MCLRFPEEALSQTALNNKKPENLKVSRAFLIPFTKSRF